MTSGMSAMVVNAEDAHILERSEAKSSGVPLFAAGWPIFIPTTVIAILYFCAWLFLVLVGKADTGLARLFIIVMSVGVPLLAAHAFLRYQTIRLQVDEGHLLCHPGWPKELPVDVPFAVIEKVKVRYGLTGKLFDCGTVIIRLTTGGEVAIADLSRPHNAKRAIVEARVRAR